MHGSCGNNLRQLFWNDLIAFNSNYPMMVIRDFNSVTDQNEKVGANHVSFNDVSAFNNMISQTGLVDAGFSRNKFTWANNKPG